MHNRLSWTLFICVCRLATIRGVGEGLMDSVKCIATEHEATAQAEATFNARLSEAKLNVKVRT